MYAVGDYSSTGGQQYYTTSGASGGNAGGSTGTNTGGTGGSGSGNYSASSGGGSSHSSSGTGGGTNGNGPSGAGGGGGGGNTGAGNGTSNQQYIVPVDEATLLGTAATNGSHQRDSPQTMTVSDDLGWRLVLRLAAKAARMASKPPKSPPIVGWPPSASKWMKAIDLGLEIGNGLLFYGQIIFFLLRIFHCLCQLILRRHDACRLCAFHSTHLFLPDSCFMRLAVDPLFGWETKKRIPHLHPHLINSYSVQFIIGFPNRGSSFFFRFHRIQLKLSLYSH